MGDIKVGQAKKVEKGRGKTRGFYWEWEGRRVFVGQYRHGIPPGAVVVATNGPQQTLVDLRTGVVFQRFEGELRRQMGNGADPDYTPDQVDTYRAYMFIDPAWSVEDIQRAAQQQTGTRNQVFILWRGKQGRQHETAQIEVKLTRRQYLTWHMQSMGGRPAPGRLFSAEVLARGGPVGDDLYRTTEADEAATTPYVALRNLIEKVRQLRKNEETMPVVEMYADAARRAGVSYEKIATAWNEGLSPHSHFGEYEFPTEKVTKGR